MNTTLPLPESEWRVGFGCRSALLRHEAVEEKLKLTIPDPGFRVQLVDVLLDVRVRGVVSG